MKNIHTVIIGAGQAGLAMSYCLAERDIPHVVIERGDIANSWATERWDSLRLLTPNWQSRLPGYAYRGADLDGYMSMPEVVSYLRTYAAQNEMPIESRTTVQSVARDGQSFRVASDCGDWLCQNVVMANGACALPNVPDFVRDLPDSILHLDPLTYRAPDQVPNGGVLVVGASASGVQIAAELCEAGHEVMLAASHHIRVPRRYRGRDIQWWMDQSGMHDQGVDDVDDINRARAVPSLQLVGDADIPLMDLNYLQRLGVTVAGRFSTVRDGKALFSGGLANACDLSDLKMRRLLRAFDDWAEDTGLKGLVQPEPIAPTRLPGELVLSLDLSRGRIRTIIWATGFRPDLSCLQLPVFDNKGRLLHDQGRVTDGLYIIGLPFLRKRKSALLDGVGADAIALANEITHRSRQMMA